MTQTILTEAPEIDGPLPAREGGPWSYHEASVWTFATAFLGLAAARSTGWLPEPVGLLLGMAVGFLACGLLHAPRAS